MKASASHGLVSAVALVAALTSCITATPASPDPEVYILAGQSNMSGRGSLAELSAEDLDEDPAIRLYGNDNQWKIAREPLDAPEGQIDVVSQDLQAGVGPGLFFARALRSLHPGREIVLVPCAKGGSSIGRWQQGGDRTSLYGSCLTRARAVGAPITGILWYQGESDGESEAKAARWGHEFARLVRAWRADLDATLLPVVFVGLADEPEHGPYAGRFPAWNAVRSAQAAIDIACAKIVSAENLDRNDDRLHLSTRAQRELGVELALAMEGLRKSGCR